MASTHVRLRALVAVAIGLMMLLTTLAPVETANAGEKGRKVRYPPARLWYRVALEFSGDADREVTYNEEVNGISHYSQAWRLESNTAVLVSLMCVDRHDPEAEPYFITRKVRDRRKRVGGCSKNAPDGHTETLRFAARATGEWERHKHSWTLNSVCGFGEEKRPYVSEQSQELIGSQALVGTISTPDSFGEGILFGVDTTSPYATWRHSGYETCDGDSWSNVEQKNWGGLLFGHVSHELLAQPSWEGGWIPLSEYFKELGRGGFGKPLEHTTAPRQVAQESGYPGPPGYTFLTALYNKRYRYTLRLEPCPERGRDVRNCN